VSFCGFFQFFPFGFAMLDYRYPDEENQLYGRRIYHGTASVRRYMPITALS
jgi:hypothetical protein